MEQLRAPRTMPSHEELERAIASVPGVVRAAVGRTPDSGRSRLRIRLAAGEDAEAVSWAVAATLRERFGIALDPAEIRPRDGPTADEDVPSLADPVEDPVRLVAPPSAGVATSERRGPAPEPRGAAPDPRGPARRDAATRVVIHGLDTDRDDREVRVVAALAHGERVARGRASTAPTANGVLRAVAEATVAALAALVAGPLAATIDRVSVQVGADPGVAMVVVSRLTERGDEMLLGSSVVRGDIERAVMRATLDALNRRVATLLDPVTLTAGGGPDG